MQTILDVITGCALGVLWLAAIIAILMLLLLGPKNRRERQLTAGEILEMRRTTKPQKRTP
jgi:hypothetical protein